MTQKTSLLGWTLVGYGLIIFLGGVIFPSAAHAYIGPGF